MEWKMLKIEKEWFAIKLIKEGSEKFIVILSDFKVLWREVISWSDIYRRVKEINPFLVLDSKMEQTIAETISTISENYTFNRNDGTFKLKYYVSGVPLHFHWKLTKCNQDAFYEEITKKLLVSLVNVQEQRNELMDVVNKKDCEIRQYKVEGALLVRKHVATQPLVETEFNRKYELKEHSGLFGITKDVRSNMNEIKIMCNYSDLKQVANKRAISNTSNVHDHNGPSLPKTPKKTSISKERDPMRKFRTNNEKVIYESNSLELLTDDELKPEADPVQNIVDEAPSTTEVPKRKLLRSKLNL